MWGDRVTLGLLLLCLFPPDVERLGDDSFAVREFEQRRFELLGRAAWPALRRAVDTHPSPEVRMRAEVLLGNLGERDTLACLRAAAVLSPVLPEPDPAALYLDHDLRGWTYWLARANGVPESEACWLLPGAYNWWMQFSEGCERDRVARAARDCRRAVWLRHWSPWFLRAG